MTESTMATGRTVTARSTMKDDRKFFRTSNGSVRNSELVHYTYRSRLKSSTTT